jgi:hypothetical protein
MWCGAAALAGAILIISAAARADLMQNQIVQGTNADLTAAGFGALNGNGVVIGQNEPSDPNVYGGAGSNVAPTSSLPDGNPNLPQGVVFIDSPNPSRANHPTEVAGVIVSTIPGQQGIATGAQVVSNNSSDVAQNGAGTWASADLMQLIQSKYIVNMSWGRNVLNNPGLFPGANNGNNYITPGVDWAATNYNTLVVVAGNEGSNANSGTASASPSDAYNVLNVGATGVRTSVNGTIDYTQVATYSQSNTTADKSAITGYGRIKTDLVAPGGDPFNEYSLLVGGTFPAQYQGTLATAPASGFIDQFQSTAGGFTTPGASYSSTDTYYGNGVVGPMGPLPPSTDTSTASAFITPTDGTTTNPGNIVPDTIAGTSFAAPEVSGAAALLYQYGLGQGYSVDHRLMKALLMNGATQRINLNGSVANLTYNGNSWSRFNTPGTITPLLAGTTAAQFGGSNPLVRPGLDPNMGTGEMNVVNSLVNYRAGQQRPTNVTGNPVNPIGWDVTTVAQGAAANTIVDKYDFSLGSGLGAYGALQATLCWDDPVTINNPGAGNTFGANSTFARNTASGGNYNPGGGAAAPLMTDLDLYLFQLNPNGTLGQNIDYSTSDIDNEEYVYAPGLAAGSYELDVADAQYNAPSATTYGLAWATVYVPEPGMATMLGVGLIAASLRHRRRSA